MIDHAKYVLMTAARNEEKYIALTLDAVTRQTVLPERWVIVSDRSTDRTDEIVEEFRAKHPFIELIRYAGDSNRNFGSQVRAIKRGYESVRSLDYQFIGNIDADVSFAPDYFERLLGKFDKDRALGLGGGVIHEQKSGKFRPVIYAYKFSVPHAIQLFRRECYEKIGGYRELKYGGSDACAEMFVRMNGWCVRSFQDLVVCHHKLRRTMEGLLRGALREGLMDYSLFAHPIFETLKCVSRVAERPMILYSIWRMMGYILGYLRREKRDFPRHIVSFIRTEQRRRILHPFG